MWLGEMGVTEMKKRTYNNWKYIPLQSRGEIYRVG